MANSTNDLIINIEANTKDAVQSIAKISDTLDQMNDALKTSAEGLGNVEKATKSAGESAVELNQAFELAGKAFEALKGLFESTVDKFTEADDIMRGLNNTLTLMGDTNVPETSAKFKEFAETLERHSTVSEETTLKLITMATAMGKTQEQAEALVRTSANLSAVTHDSVQATFDQLISTYKGVVRGVSQYDVGLKSLTADQLQHGAAVQMLDKDYAGFAETLVNTYGGQAAVVKNLTEHTLEAIGGLFANFFKLDDKHLLIDALIQINEYIKDLTPTVKAVRADIDEFIAHVVNGFQAIQDKAALLEVVIGTVGIAMLAAFGPAMVTSITAIATAIGTAVLAALPMIATITAVVAGTIVFGGALDIVSRNLSKFVDLFNTFFGAVIIALSQIGVAMINVFNPDNIIKAFTTTGAGLFDQMFTDIKNTVTGAFDTVKASADKNLSNLDFGVIGMAVNGATNFIKGFNQQLDTTAKATDSVTTGAKRTTDAMTGLSKEGQSAFDNLVKKVEELRLKQTELGQNVVEIANQRLIAENKNLDIAEKDLQNKGALNAEAVKLLATARQITAANSNLEVYDKQKKALDEILQKNIDIQAGVDSYNKTQIEIIDIQLDRQIQLVEKKREELQLQGLLTDAAKAQIDRQESLLKQGAGQAKEKAPTQVQDSLQIAGANIGKNITDAFAPIVGFTNGVNAAVAAAQAVVDAIPQMLDNVTKLLDSITALPMKILSSLQSLFSSILTLIANILPNLVKAIEGILTAAVDFLKKLPQVLISAIMQIPKLVTSLLQALPDIIKNLIESLVTMAPQIVGALLEFLIKDAPKIALELAYYLAIELPKAIIDGLIEAFKQIGGMISDLFKGKFNFLDPKDIEKTLANIVTKMSASASKLFAVTDLGTATTNAKSLTSSIAAEVDRTLQKLKDAWMWVWDHIIKPIIDALVKVWQWVWDKILSPILDLVMKAFQWVWDNILYPIIELVQEAFQWVWDHIFQPIVNLVRKAFQWVWDNVIAPIVNVVKVAFTGAAQILTTYWNAIFDTLKSVWNGLMNIFSAEWNGLITILKAAWTYITSVFSDLWAGIQKIWNTMMDIFSGKVSILAGLTTIFQTVFQTAANILIDAFKFFQTVGNAIGNLLQTIFDSVKNVIQTMLDGAGKVGTAIWNAFQTTFGAATKAIGDIGTNIWNGVKAGFDGATKYFTNIGTQIWNGLKTGLDTLEKFFGDLFNKLNPANLVQKMFHADFPDPGPIQRTLHIGSLPYLAFASGGTVPGNAMVGGDSEMNDRVLALLSPGEAVISRSKLNNPAIKSIVDAIVSGRLDVPKYSLGSAVGGVVKSVKNAVSSVTSLTPDDILDELKQGASIAESVIKSLDPSRLWDLVKDKVDDSVMAMFQANHFSTGGYVGSDTVPAMLTPGEFVLNRGAVSAAGLSNLQSMNHGSSGNKPGNVTYNIELPITITNNGKTVDASYIRDQLMPTIRNEIKRASLNGDFVISQKGIRNA